MSLKENIVLNLKNILGRSINRKIVVIECDDWGSMRMPSIDVYNYLEDNGFNVGASRYNRFDSMANSDDLQQLFNVLSNACDKNGHPAVLTPFCNVANPDYGKIESSEFKKYYNESFLSTLKRVNPRTDVFTVWKEGMKKKIFMPEFHGREHLTVQLWMKALQDGDEMTREAFKYKFAFVDTAYINRAAKCFRPEFYFENNSEIDFLTNSLVDGINRFNDLFGYLPSAFVPGNGIFHPVLFKTMSDVGVKYLNINHFLNMPMGEGNLRKKFYKNHKWLIKNKLRAYARNCAFEPTDKYYKGIALTIRQIDLAFRWSKPAIISTHRVNFVGGFDESNREKGLSELSKLLKQIMNKWPDVEFMSSSQLFKTLFN